MVLDIVAAAGGTRYSMLTVAEPLAVVAAAGGCDLMSRRPICSRFGQIFAVKILDVVC